MANRSKDQHRGTYLFQTTLGTCGLAWTARGIDRVQLPEADRDATAGSLRRLAPDRELESRPPATIGRLARRIAGHLAGRPDPMADVALDLAGTTPFAARVYEALRRVPPGKVVTYGELARLAGSPGAARAVGGAMAANPLPVLVPCHRVLPAGGSLGGFSAHGGAALKARMLFSEGVVPDRRHAAGIEALRRADPTLRRIIRRVGPFLPRVNAPQRPYDTLVESIIHQQLSIKAAATIARRVRALTPGPRMPRPAELRRLRDARLRRAGLSARKVSYVRNLAQRVERGALPLGRLPRMGDEQVIATLTAVKGIGRWSAQMFLIFHLGRLDVLPVDDLGLRNAVKEAYGLAAPATADELRRRGARWRPFRSMASWYLWQSVKAAGP